jgi:hypothetical protein
MSSSSIFTSIPLCRIEASPPPAASDEPLYEPPPLAILPKRVALPPPVPALDAQLAAILDAPLALGETAAVGFARKERELGTVFAELSPLAARALHLRLEHPTPGDALAAKFARLTIERRHRLLVFLADARRREALRGAR